LATGVARRALELDPSLARPHGVLAWVAVSRGRYAEALAEHRAQLEALPETERERRAAVYNNMATCFFRMRQPEEALSALREALALDPERPTYRYNLAMLLLHLRQPVEAQGELERLLALPEVPPEIALMARFNLGHLYAGQGRYGEAREQFLRAQTVRKTFPGWLYSRLPFLARFPAYLLLIILVAIVLLLWNFFLRR
ncbi:MAG: tetratricopeptide repeat protein, partial [Chloroflexia bacterium]